MAQSAKQLEQALEREVSRVIVGKNDKLKLITAALLADGHVLLDDRPGVGKTTLVKALARALGCGQKRVQFTPDLLPSDVIGMNIYDRASGAFRRLDGPVKTNLLLADELNRAIPRTQSALLEAMEERQVTLDGVTEALPEPFFVLATQNPVESESTFRLPAAQLDRFLLCLSMGYPSPAEELTMLKTVGDSIPFEAVQAVTGPEELCAIRKQVQSEVTVSDEIAAYIVAIGDATRHSPLLRLGASPRAAKAMYRAAKAMAAVSGRDFVTPDDVLTLAEPLYCHRLMLSSEALRAGKTAQSVLAEILSSVPVPPKTADVFHE